MRDKKAADPDIPILKQAEAEYGDVKLANLGASCARQSNFALFGKPRGVAQRLKNVITLQIRIVRQQLLDGVITPSPVR
jgi:hypothetical protein